MTDQLSPLERLRRSQHQRWLADRREALAQVMAGGLLPGAGGCVVYLFGSRARGNWDGYSDTDLLVVAPTRQQADVLADRLLDAGLGDDVIALSAADWQAAADSPSPYWRSIWAQAIPLYECPSTSLAPAG